MNRAVRLVVKGRVQGVGFRWFANQKARSLGVKGYVRNLPNGDVETVAEGKKEAVDAYIQAIKEGPSFAHVSDTEQTELPFEN